MRLQVNQQKKLVKLSKFFVFQHASYIEFYVIGDKSVGHGPDGPYTSTPEGNLVLKKPSSRSVAVAVSKKDLMLHHIVSGFLTRRMESIELMPVSSSSSSDLHVDSSLITRSPSSTGASTSFHSPFGTSASEFWLT